MMIKRGSLDNKSGIENPSKVVKEHEKPIECVRLKSPKNGRESTTNKSHRHSSLSPGN